MGVEGSIVGVSSKYNSRQSHPRSRESFELFVEGN